jgi:hypothetical protein
MRKQFGSTVMWWLGIVLVGMYVALAAPSVLFLLFDCDVDCGDQGGRAAFVRLVVFSPLAIAGFGIAAAAAAAGRPRLTPRALRRIVLTAGWSALAVGAVVLGVLGIAAGVTAVNELLSSFTVGDARGPGDYQDYASAQARKAALAWTVVASLMLGLALVAGQIARRVRRAARPPLSH